MTPTHPLRRPARAAGATLACLLPAALSAQPTLEFDTNPATPGAQAGSGNWSGAGGTWWDGAAHTAWQSGAHARFVGAGTVTLTGRVEAASLEGPAAAVLGLDVGSVATPSGRRLDLAGPLSGGLTVRFTGANPGTNNAYNLALRESTGLHFRPLREVEAAFDVRLTNLNSPPVLGVHGAGSVVRYRGFWEGEQGNTFSLIHLTEGGRLVLTAGAEMDFLNSSYFTRQMWVLGDGTGTVELEPDFVGDRSQAGTVPSGLAAIRLANATLVTHTSASLPFSYRLGGAQPNGHMVFENTPGGVWWVKSNPQSYAGAIWLWVDCEFRCDEDFVHDGLTVPGGDYTAYNAFQTLADNVTVKKTGPGTLTLGREAGFFAGARLDVREGALALKTDPTGTALRGGTTSGQTLTLAVAAGARAVLEASAERAAAIRLLAVENAGAVEVGSTVRLAGDLTLQAGAELVFRLANTQQPGFAGPPKLEVAGTATLAGKLTVQQAVEDILLSGEEVTLLTAGNVAGTFAEVEGADGAEVVYEPGRVILRGVDAETFAAWAARAEFALPEGQRGPLANPAGDGLPNLWKFALGLNPSERVGRWPFEFALVAGPEGPDYPAVRFRRPRGFAPLPIELEYKIGQGWNVDLPQQIAVEDNGDGTETVTMRAGPPQRIAPWMMLRLRLGGG